MNKLHKYLDYYLMDYDEFLEGLTCQISKEFFTLKDKYYKTFYIKKKRGGVREINQPIDNLLFLQKRINAYLLMHRSNNLCVSYGFENHKSIVDGALLHTNKKWVLNIDIKDFFCSINEDKIKEVFKPKFKKVRNLNKFIQIITYNNGLPQGAPCSPTISNYICDRLDFNILKYIINLNKGIVYSRYADDLTFSSNNEIEIEDFIKNIKKLLSEYGFSVNQKKIKFYRYYRNQEVTGLTVNEKVNIKRNFIKKIRAILYNWGKNEEETMQQFFRMYPKKSEKARFHKIIRGWIDFVGQVRGKKDPIYLKFLDQYHKNISNY